MTRIVLLMLLLSCGRPAMTLETTTGGVMLPLPECPAGTTTGELVLTSRFCTLRACTQACCNTCSWTATFDGAPAGHLEVEQVLGAPGSMTTCELEAWQQALAPVVVNLQLGCATKP